MVHNQQALMAIGETLPSSDHIDVNSLVNYKSTLRAAVRTLSEFNRKKLSSAIPTIMEIDGRTSDGKTHAGTGNKYYDFVLQYMEVKKMPFESVNSSMRTLVAVLKRRNGE